MQDRDRDQPELSALSSITSDGESGRPKSSGLKDMPESEATNAPANLLAPRPISRLGRASIYSPTSSSTSPRSCGWSKMGGTRTPPAKKSCLDQAKNGTARVVARIRTGHWRSAEFLKRIKKRGDDRCWFCRSGNRITGFHVLLHCPGAKVRAACGEAWGVKTRARAGRCCQTRGGKGGCSDS